MNVSITAIFRYYSIVCFLLLFGSCSRHLIKSPSLDEVRMFPPPPDTARLQYLVSFSNSEHIAGRESSLKRYLFGQREHVSIIKPYGLSVHDARIYVCDPGLEGVIIIDLLENSMERFVPKGLGQLKLPLACALDDRGYLYVADGERAQIVVYDEKLRYVSAFGDTDEFRPTDISVLDGNIWVVNIKGHSVKVYDSESYELVETVPSYREGEKGYLYQPSSLYLTEKLLYVTDFGDFRIKKYTHDGQFAGEVGDFGLNLGQLARPKGICVDRDGNLYVVDAAYENVQIFNDRGQLLMYFGGPYKEKGDMYLPADVHIDYRNLDYFLPYVNENFALQYLVLVTNQYGPDKLNVYGFVKPK